MMKQERVFSGLCLNLSLTQDWFGGEKHSPEIAQLIRFAKRGVPVCVASRGDLPLASFEPIVADASGCQHVVAS